MRTSFNSPGFDQLLDKHFIADFLTTIFTTAIRPPDGLNNGERFKVHASENNAQHFETLFSVAVPLADREAPFPRSDDSTCCVFVLMQVKHRPKNMSRVMMAITLKSAAITSDSARPPPKVTECFRGAARVERGKYHPAQFPDSGFRDSSVKTSIRTVAVHKHCSTLINIPRLT